MEVEVVQVYLNTSLNFMSHGELLGNLAIKASRSPEHQRFTAFASTVKKEVALS